MTSDQIESIIEAFDLSAEYFVWQMEHGKHCANDSDRGSWLGDGDEYEETINGTTYYIYKI